MKITIEFDTENPEHCAELNRHKVVNEMVYVLSEFKNYLRTNWKYRDTPDDIDKIYETYNELLFKHVPNFEEI